MSQHSGADNSLIHAALSCPPKTELDFGMVVIDEAQDMNGLYAKFIKHVLSHMKERPVMVLVGDPFQRIFGFNGASCDFLVNPEKHFGELCRSPRFVTRHLTICWRITHEMAGFINSHLNPCNLQHAIKGQWWSRNGPKIRAWWGSGIKANPQKPPAPDSLQILRGWGTPLCLAFYEFVKIANKLRRYQRGRARSRENVSGIRE